MPALAIDMVCCSMASWMATWSEIIHLVKFVDSADPIIRKHQCASLDSESPLSLRLSQPLLLRPAAEEAFPEV